MPSRPKLILLGAGFTVSHFLATWYIVLQAWEHDWASRLMKVMQFPARLTDFGGGKFSNMALMFVNSVLWGFLFTALVVLACWIFRRKAHD